MRIDTTLRLKQLQKIHNIAGIGYYICEYQSDKMWWSDLIFRILGYAEQEFVPSREKFFKHVHPHDLGFLKKSLNEMISKPIEIEFRFYKNGNLRLGKLTGEVSIDKFSTPTEEVLFQDITDSQVKEFEISKTWHKTLEAEELKNSFLANMSHELRTPLNSIIGFSELLETGDTDIKTKKFAHIIKKSGLQLLKIIEDIMKVSMLENKISKLIIQDFNLNQMLLKAEENAYSLLKSYNKEHLKLNFSFSENQCDIIKSDQTKIQNILKNLIHNAIKFTNEGTISCFYKIENNSVQFTVKDTGSGIPNKLKNRIFQRFRKENKIENIKHGGTGLGLYISRLEVELLGGKIWYISEKNAGTTINFIIPNVVVSSNCSDIAS